TAPATTVTSACGFHKAASFCCIHGLDSVFLFSLFSLLSFFLSISHTRSLSSPLHLSLSLCVCVCVSLSLSL
ncbi:MAG TPA: hypothetical protein V6C97_12545, partial [Oculatellaceae cyanobacterium]